MITVGSQQWTRFQFVTAMKRKHLNKALSLFELLAIVKLVYPNENPTEVLNATRLYIKYNDMDYPNDFYGTTQVTEEYIETDGSDDPPEFLG